MLAQILIFLIKIAIGTTLGAIGIYNAKRKKKNKMRKFDQITPDYQNEFLITCIEYAKQYIADENLPIETDVIAIAVEFGEFYLLEADDFIGMDIELYNGWVGGRPTHRPKSW